MHNHDRTAVAVQEWMPEGEIAHDLAGLSPHEICVLSLCEGGIDGSANVLWMGKEDATSTDRNFRCVVGSILSCPSIHCLESRPVCIQNILVAELLDRRELLERIVKAGCE